MASVPVPAVNIGDFVYTENKLCYVKSIENMLGFNQYCVVDIDTGISLNKARHQLEMPEMKLLLNETFEEADGTQKQEEKDKKSQKRFAEVTESDINDYALNRNSKRTRTQTVWAVSIFKGRS
jgi:hypothetical protein